MKPILYVLVRTDLDSMTPGRVAAQVGHAVSVFHGMMERADPETDLFNMYTKWKSETPYGYGTKIILDGQNLDRLLEELYKIPGDLVSSLSRCITDPEYAVRDGEVIHILPVDTCAFAFVDADNYSFSLELYNG